MSKKMIMKSLNNRGSTLIEVIVTVLIVGIVFVPLLMSLNTALKANTKARDSAYAESAATSCMEVIKTMGYGKLQSEIPMGSSKTLTGLGTAVRTSADSKEKAEFTISNISEGTQTYNAKVSISSAKYTKNDTDAETVVKQNDQKVIKFNNLAADASNPAVTKNVVSVYVTADYETGLETTISSYKRDSITLPADYDPIANVKEKQTVLEIGQLPDSDPSYPNWYYIKTKVQYRVNNKTSEGDDIFVGFEGRPDAYFFDPGITQTFKNVPQSILLYYSAMKEDGSTLGREYIVIDKKISDDINIYTFCSSETILNKNLDGTDITKHSLNFAVMNYISAETTNVKIYSSSKQNKVIALPDTGKALYIQNAEADVDTLNDVYEDVKTSEYTKISETYEELVVDEEGNPVVDPETHLQKTITKASPEYLFTEDVGRRMYEIKVEIYTGTYSASNVKAKKVATIVE